MYIYLKNKEFVSNWINEGKVPLNPASKYSDKERNGVKTPDENIQIEITGEIIRPRIRTTIEKVINIGKGTLIQKGNVIQDDTIVGKNITYKQSWEDCIILSISKTLSSEILEKLRDKDAVIEIIDFEKLKSSLDKQIGIVGDCKDCIYTETDERNHFLKHKDDSWQEEFRIIWLGIDKTTWVKLPTGIAIDVTHKIRPTI
jgi:hypothetical protein